VLPLALPYSVNTSHWFSSFEHLRCVQRMKVYSNITNKSVWPDAIGSHRHKYVMHWPHWPSSAACRHYCAARPVRPVPDQYALQTDKQMNERMNERTNKQTSRQTDGHHHCVKLPLCCGDIITLNEITSLRDGTTTHIF